LADFFGQKKTGGRKVAECFSKAYGVEEFGVTQELHFMGDDGS
jgi:hypothetical protein